MKLLVSWLTSRIYFYFFIDPFSWAMQGYRPFDSRTTYSSNCAIENSLFLVSRVTLSDIHNISLLFLYLLTEC